MTESNGYLSEGSARELSKVVKWFRGLPRGNEHKPPTAPTQGGGPWLGVTQAQIGAANSGPVNFWSGNKGQETDTKVTVQVFNRLSLISANSFVVFDYVDSGYEIIFPTFNQSQDPNIGSGVCPCTCVNGTSVSYWQLTTQFVPGIGAAYPFNGCCGGSDTLPTILYATGTNSWTSQPFICQSQTTQWNLSVVGDFLTLTLTVGTGVSQSQILYRVKDYSPICSNPVSLWEPITVPGGSSCFMPCQMCLVPVQQFYCDSCPVGSVPSAFTITFPTGFTAPLNTGTYNLTTFATTGDGNPPSQSVGCQWSIVNVPGPNNTKAKIVLDMRGKAGDAANNSAINLTVSLGLPGATWSQFEGQPQIVFYSLYSKCSGITTLQPLSANNWLGVSGNSISSSWTPIIQPAIAGQVIH